MDNHHSVDAILKLKWLGINTYKEAIIYLREDSNICSAEGYEAPARIEVKLGDRSIIATLNTIKSDLLHRYEASLSLHAWNVLGAKEGDEITVIHPKALASLGHVRSKVYGKELKEDQINSIIEDVTKGYLSDVQIAMFLASTTGARLNEQEIYYLTKAMIHTGQQLRWQTPLIVDKHCVGGLPGNRTSLLVVPIVAAFGLTIPKTSSRAITSPAGTADTMEVLAPVDLSLDKMRKVVEQEHGCIVWGGSVELSPADDILIRIERAMDLDSDGQLVASILSKKIAAGSTHIVIDIPVGPSVKIRSLQTAQRLQHYLETVGKHFNVKIKTLITDGTQPIGRGIGPALEAKDVLAVLMNDKNAPQDLRERSLTIAGKVIEFSPNVTAGTGIDIARKILDSGLAFKKFQEICIAQGGFKEPKTASHTSVIVAKHSGIVTQIENHRISRIAKLAGAPQSQTAGVELLVRVGDTVEKSQPLFVLHSQSQGELNYALSYLSQRPQIFHIEHPS